MKIQNINEIESALRVKLHCVAILQGNELPVPEHLKEIFAGAPEHEADVRQVRMETALRELQKPLPLPVIGEPSTIIAPDFE
jgi:hypothetical protein